MHHAPSVSYPVGRSRFARACMGALALLSAGALLLWGWQARSAPVWLWLGWGLWGVALGVCLWQVRHSPLGHLQWHEGAWRFTPALVSASALHEGLPLPQPLVVLDLQQVMLLHWPAARPRWLWLSRQDNPSRWNALRRAVYARGPRKPGRARASKVGGP